MFSWPIHSAITETSIPALSNLGRGVTQDVGRNFLLLQSRTRRCGDSRVSGDTSLQRVPAQRGAAQGDEQRIVGPAGAFGEPGVQDRAGGGGQGGDRPLPAFTEGA